jgi:glyoxylase-like metal-dependent hydrolase (beta-lactamase superfamily II)
MSLVNASHLRYLTPLLLLLAVLAGPLLGASLAKAQEAPGFFRLKIGDLSATALADARGTLGADLLRGVSDEEFASGLARAGLQAGAKGLPSFVNAFLVETREGLVLVDAGTGPQGLLAKSLSEAGIDPGDVRYVLLTHFHGDHLGGLIDEGGKAVFKNAVVLASKAEDEHWLKRSPSAKAAEALAPYQAEGRYRLFEPGGEVLPGVEAVELYGHTPGHCGFLFDAGGGARLLAWGDIVHAAYVQFANPAITLAYDTDEAAAAETRRRVFEEAAAGGWTVAGAHLPFPGLGTLSAAGGGAYALAPVEAD